MFFEERGLSLPWKTPLPLAKKALLVFFDIVVYPLFTREAGRPPSSKASGRVVKRNLQLSSLNVDFVGARTKAAIKNCVFI